MLKPKCYGPFSDECPRRGVCVLYVKPPAVSYPCRDYREHWDVDEQTTEVCASFEVTP